MGRRLASYERELISRGAAERTRRALPQRLVQFAGWRWSGAPNARPGRAPRRSPVRGAAIGVRCRAATVARKLASVRGFYDHFVRSGQLGQNSADLVGSPKRASKLPKVLSPEQMASCWTGSRPHSA